MTEPKAQHARQKYFLYYPRSFLEKGEYRFGRTGVGLGDVAASVVTLGRNDHFLGLVPHSLQDRHGAVFLASLNEVMTSDFVRNSGHSLLWDFVDVINATFSKKKYFSIRICLREVFLIKKVISETGSRLSPCSTFLTILFWKLTQVWCHLRWSTARGGFRAGRERVCRWCRVISSRRRFFLAELYLFWTVRAGSSCSCCTASRSEGNRNRWLKNGSRVDATLQYRNQSCYKVPTIIETHSTVDFWEANCNNKAQNVFHLGRVVWILLGDLWKSWTGTVDGLKATEAPRFLVFFNHCPDEQNFDKQAKRKNAK